jgi:hypothetical protein
MTNVEKRMALQEIARRYNAALATGKVKARRNAASEAHDLVFKAIKELEAIEPQDVELLREANALFLDIRFGQPTTFPF